MGKFFQSIQPAHRDFIARQHLFFVGTAPISADGRVNISPKGLDSFRVLSENRVAYLDFVGSGNETSAHTLENGRITFMFCAFEGAPLILRLYGLGRTVLPDAADWADFSNFFEIKSQPRQIIVAEIDLVGTSCGFGVPIFEFVGERPTLFEWAAKKGEAGLKNYIFEKNRVSLDGLPSDFGVKFENFGTQI